MSISLPPMPDPSNPPLPVSRIDSRMRPINKLQSLKRHMKEAQVHVFNHNAIPTFPVSLSRLMSNQFSSAQKSEYRRDGKAKVRNTIQSMMNGVMNCFGRSTRLLPLSPLDTALSCGFGSFKERIPRRPLFETRPKRFSSSLDINTKTSISIDYLRASISV
ncbi:hypothetical protein F5880DRAFT_1280465 [Lentinula raphanica]|nr:hypothetical protein F5880DRAFT_1280465 [Lentinula raphanica]